MKAIVYTEYGSPDVLSVEDVAKPTPKDDEVLIKVRATAANPLDWRCLKAEPFLIRLMTGLFRPKHNILGADVAGWVEAVGRHVTQFRPGDEVFGCTHLSGLGGFAEYVCAPAEALVHKPTTVSFEEAAAVPVAALCALQGLRDHGQLRPGQRVLINGASGGVGTYAVQLARHFEAEVTGVCSTRNVEMVRRLGADHVIDYTKEDFTQTGERYDLLLDNVGNPDDYRHFYEHSLTPNGICVIVAGSFFLRFVRAPWMRLTGSDNILTYTTDSSNRQDLGLMMELFMAGDVRAVIDRCYPLDEVPEALTYLLTHRARGKVIITLN